MTHPHPPAIDATTRVCAVYGRPIRHSASPAMHNAAFLALGLNWRYVVFDVNPDHLREALLGAKRMHFVGINLTVPHKVLALELMDVLDDSARTWGAVNTVRFEGLDASGKWVGIPELKEPPAETRMRGFNTDADAITTALQEDLGIVVKGARVMLLGAGGAGRAAALKIASQEPAELHLVNRTVSKAEALLAEIRECYPGVNAHVGYPSGAVDLLLNATSLGLGSSDGLPFDSTQFSLTRAGTVYDMIYRPAETPFLKAAAQAGCRTANGLGMLLHQGAKALEIWSGRSAPLEAMRQALRESIYG